MGTKILVVDDEIDMHQLISLKYRKQIQSAELNFIFASNGAEAISILKNDQEINIIFTDINMPVMGGLELLRNLKQLRDINSKKFYKTVVVSAYSDMSNIRIAMNEGASDFLTKPINFEDYTATLKKSIMDYNAMESALQAAEMLEEFKIELNIAKELQQSMLPRNFHPLPNSSIELAGKMIPAKVVGGDFFDFFPVSSDKLGMVIADVSGKSLSACIYMIVARSFLRFLCSKGYTCETVVSRLAEFLSRDNESGMFVTIFYAVLDVRNGHLVYCNSGHYPPFLIGCDGNIRKIEGESGHVLGVNQIFKLAPKNKENSMFLSDKDTLFFYTDGVTEALNKNNEFFTEERLIETLKLASKKSPSEMLEFVHSTLLEFMGGANQYDDITMMAVRLPKATHAARQD